MSIVQVSDFIGRYKLAKQSYNINDIQAYIDMYEPVAIRQLLGIELGDAFISDIDPSTGLPASPEFIAIFNPFTVDPEWYDCFCDSINMSMGMKDYIKGIVYWWYVCESGVSTLAQGGSAQVKSEAIVQGTNVSGQIYQRYNDSISTGKAIQAFVRHNDGNYDSFKMFSGQTLLYNYSM